MVIPASMQAEGNLATLGYLLSGTLIGLGILAILVFVLVGRARQR